MPEEFVTISKEEYEDLKRDHQLLLKLVLAFSEIAEEWEG
jgi:hypothetical protein